VVRNFYHHSKQEVQIIYRKKIKIQLLKTKLLLRNVYNNKLLIEAGRSDKIQEKYVCHVTKIVKNRSKNIMFN
jgi:hypothetical protein